MATAWMHYWKAPQIRDGLEAGRLTHVASQQFNKVEPGDRVWIVSVNGAGRLYTIGYVDARDKLTWEEANRRVDYEPWNADWHFIVPERLAIQARIVDLQKIAPRLRFISPTRPRLTVNGGRTNGQELQSIRKLQPESARLLAELWENGRNAQSEWERHAGKWDEAARLESRRELLVREEQGFVRRRLLGGRTEGVCALCGELFPVELLIAAHVKRRSGCTDDEKRDFANNVVPMCKLGCDDLFERGYVVVRNGRVRAGPTKALTAAVRAAVGRLTGREVVYFTPVSARYFEWHEENAGRTPRSSEPRVRKKRRS